MAITAQSNELHQLHILDVHKSPRAHGEDETGIWQQVKHTESNLNLWATCRSEILWLILKARSASQAGQAIRSHSHRIKNGKVWLMMWLGVCLWLSQWLPFCSSCCICRLPTIAIYMGSVWCYTLEMTDVSLKCVTCDSILHPTNRGYWPSMSHVYLKISNYSSIWWYHSGGCRLDSTVI